MPFPRARQTVVDAGRLGIRRHVIHRLLELDITLARRVIRDHQAETGDRLSFTGFLINCLAPAVQDHPMTNTYLNWRGQLVVFEDVGAVTLIETKVGGVALHHVIRAANRKSFLDIHQEIRAIRAKPQRSAQRKAWLQEDSMRRALCARSSTGDCVRTRSG